MDLFSSIGMQEILVILLVAMLVIGPNKIAEFGKTLGNVSRNLKKASTDFTTSITREIDEEEKSKKTEGAQTGKPEAKKS
ncbi:MAG: twin-arginine translocase TatA/TatE family subunit [Dehalococcoidia bacterium]|nr:twin-arginine translocase TatA/TatE family subunit [Dehalococcoidia bacterium]